MRRAGGRLREMNSMAPTMASGATITLMPNAQRHE